MNTKKVFSLLLMLVSLAVYSQTAETYFEKGTIKYDARNYSGALADFDKAIELNPKNATFYYNRGALKDRLEDTKGAIEDYNNVIALDSNNAWAYSNRGYAKYKLGHINEACLDWYKSQELGLEKANRMIKKYCVEEQ